MNSPCPCGAMIVAYCSVTEGMGALHDVDSMMVGFSRVVAMSSDGSEAEDMQRPRKSTRNQKGHFGQSAWTGRRSVGGGCIEKRGML